jgi:RNA polymerase sigma-70 factor (ECF subfamily)
VSVATLAGPAPSSLHMAGLLAWLRSPDGPHSGAGHALAPAPDGDEDAELVRQCLAGQRSAFDELYRRHAVTVHRRLTRLVGASPEVEDLMQQVFLEAFRSLPRFRGDSTFKTWLYRIAINVALGALRKRKRHPSIAIDPQDLDAIVSSGLTPEARARERELYERTLRHLDKIAPKHKIAFVLRHVEQLSLEEIAEMVGAKAPAVAQRVRKAERELAKRMALEERRAERRREEQRAPRVS